MWFWFAFPLWPGMLSISSCVFGCLDFFLWKGSVQFICPFLHWIIDVLGSSVFWVSYIFRLLILCQMYSWQKFSTISWVTSSIWWPFISLWSSFLVLYQYFSFMSILFLSYWAIWFLFRKSLLMLIGFSIPCSFPALASKCQVL
jgi:hypothetical protein